MQKNIPSHIIRTVKNLKINFWKNKTGLIYIGKKVIYCINPSEIKIMGDVIIYENTKNIIEIDKKEINFNNWRNVTYEEDEWDDNWIWNYFNIKNENSINIIFLITGIKKMLKNDIFFEEKSLKIKIKNNILEAEYEENEVFLTYKIISKLINTITSDYENICEIQSENEIKDEIDLYFLIKKKKMIIIKMSEEITEKIKGIIVIKS